MDPIFSYTMTNTRKHDLNFSTDKIYYLRRAKICDLQGKTQWWTNVIKKYIKEQIKIFPYMRNRKTFLERSQSLCMRKITGLFQWEEHQFPHISIISPKKICAFKQNSFIPQIPRTSFWNIKWLFTDWKKTSCPFQMWSGSSTLEKHFVRRETNGDPVPQFHTLCPGGSHQLVRNENSQPHHPPLRPFVWTELVWIKLLLLMQENSFAAKNSQLMQICKPCVGLLGNSYLEGQSMSPAGNTTNKKDSKPPS